MTAQYAGIITIVATAILTALFFFLLSRLGPERPATEMVPKVYAVRNRYFQVLIAVVIGSLVWTLRMLPYPQLQAKQPTMNVTVIGRQWSWQMIKGEYNKEMLKSKASDNIIIPVGTTVQFHVTAADVTHGFGIYTPDGKLLGQTQVMPTYVNRLIFTFKEPGIYPVLCMEYCGVAHHIMTTLVQVEGS